jgi:hypothetical protein
MSASHLLEDRDRPQARCRLEHRYDLGVKNSDQRIRRRRPLGATFCDGSRGSFSMRYDVFKLIAAWAAAAGFISVSRDFMYSLIW